jgi:hypothetical protein
VRSVVDPFGSLSMRRTDRLKSEASHRPDVIQKILKHLGLDQPDWASSSIHLSAHRNQC